MFQKHDKFRRYVFALLYVLVLSGIFFLWMWIAERDNFSSLMSSYGPSLITYFGMLVVVVPLVTALITKPQSDTSSTTYMERKD